VRVVLFTDTIAPNINGVARTLDRLVRHAHARGVEIGVVSPLVDGPPAVGAAFHHRLPGIPAPVYPELVLSRPLDAAGRSRLRDFRPDVVHVATESVIGISGVRWAARARVPLVTSFHTDFASYLKGYRMAPARSLVWRHLRTLHEKAALTYCPSSSTLELLRAHGFHDRLRIWSRGVDSEHFHPRRRSEAVRERLAPGARTILLFVGRLAYEKRLDVLLQAFAMVREAHGQGVALVLVGEGPLGREIRRDAPPGVHCLGYLQGDDLADAYASADAFVFPSDTETFGNVVLEAMSSGLPVVAVRAGGVTETVREGETGILVPAGDAQAVAGAVLGLLRVPDLRRRLGEGGRREAQSRAWGGVLDGLMNGWAEVAGAATVAQS